MAVPPDDRQLPVILQRDTPFSYQCRACRRCCHDKRIQLNPYELARLSRYLDCSTTDVIAKFTSHGGTALASRPDGACVFLGETGCTVHSARPLACRLYPLGRIALDDGREVYIEHTPHPETEGIYGTNGTVGDFLTSQEVAPYLSAAERYYAILQLLLEPHVAVRGDVEAAPGSYEDDGDAVDFIDADRAVGRASGSAGEAHLSAEELVDLHLTLLERRALELTSGHPNPRLHGP